MDKNLDAITALRHAMEERLAQGEPRVQDATRAEAQPEKKADKPAQEAPKSKASSLEPDPTPLYIDPIEWSDILVNVTEKSQKLIQGYVQKMRERQSDTQPFSAMPMLEQAAQYAIRFLEDPEAYTEMQLAMWQHCLDLTRATMRRLQGRVPETEFGSEAKNDKRFKAKDWETNWLFDFMKQTYLSASSETRRMVQQETAHIKNKLARKIEFYTRLFLDASSPNNFWLTNPEVLRETMSSHGENLVKGLENLLQDIERGNGTLNIRMSDYQAFEVGKNIASTPGQVVYQNDLMQLIQYSPSTENVRRVPLLIIPPWINKYYILDLRDKNSYIRYLVAQGFTVFCISWVNPTKRLALTRFEDYMDKGALTAMREIKHITGEEVINTLGYCIGGTLLACLQAYLAALDEYPEEQPKIASSTYLVTMIDFSDPGDLGVFIDEEQIRMLEDRMARQGFMDAATMAMTFNLLRANDLIWPFVINNYLMGREPYSFDILYWNGDSTNLPATMQSYYLRKMYLENKLVMPDALKMREVPIDLGKIKTPSFLLSTREDHIAPWRSTYAATHLYEGPVTFVLAGSGHVAGIVNPPNAEKYSYWTNANSHATPEEWLEKAQEHKGSWWPEFCRWLTPYSGEEIPAREVEAGIEKAPGSYVKVRMV